MSSTYCANCGAQVETIAVCPHCHLDPCVPEAIIDQFLGDTLKQRKTSSEPAGTVASMIEYPGERTSLLLSISVLIAVALLIGTVTFGVSLLLITIAILSVPLQEARSKATLICATENHYAELARLTKIAAFRLDVRLPDLYVEQEIAPNAYTAGFWRKHWIVLRSSLLDLCTPSELLFVIGHEIGHIKRQHTSWLAFTSARPALTLPLVREVVTLIFNNWLLRAEYSADRAGLVACRDVNAAVSALIRIQYWEKPADLEQLKASWKSLERDPLVRASELFGDHPDLHHRVDQLTKFEAVLHGQAVL